MHYSWITRQASSVYVLSCLFIFIVDLLWNKRRKVWSAARFLDARRGFEHKSVHQKYKFHTNKCVYSVWIRPCLLQITYTVYTGGKRDTSLYRPGFTPKRASNCLHVVLESSCGTDSTRARCSVVSKLEVSRHRGWWWWRWGCCWWNFGRVHQIHQCFCWSVVSFKSQPHTHTHTQLFPVSMLS